MKEILIKFNMLLLNGQGAVAVISSDSDDNINSAVAPKSTPEEFISTIELALNEGFDCKCVIMEAEEFDYGYLLELKVSVTDADGDVYFMTFYLTYTTLY